MVEIILCFVIIKYIFENMITHIDASKANTIDALSFHFGISLEDTIAFGDDKNDIEMIQKCGIGVAMENSIAELEMYADYICSSNENDGVAKWIEKNLTLQFDIIKSECRF